MRLLLAAERPARAGELAVALDVEPSHLTRHLQILQFAKLITVHRNGRVKMVGALSDEGNIDLVTAAVKKMSDRSGLLAKDLVRLL